MQSNLGNGVIIAGKVSKDAELKYVGDKQTAMCTFGVMVGKDAENKTVFANCKAWRDIGLLAASIRKGDNICVIGTPDEFTTTDGKVFKSINVEWFNNASAMPVIAQETHLAEPPINNGFNQNDGFAQVDIDDDLPF